MAADGVTGMDEEVARQVGLSNSTVARLKAEIVASAWHHGN